MGKVWLKCIIEIFFGQMFLRTCAKHQTFKNINNLYRGLDTYIQLLMTVCIFRIVDMGWQCALIQNTRCSPCRISFKFKMLFRLVDE